jgi:hypothetical protein
VPRPEDSARPAGQPAPSPDGAATTPDGAASAPDDVDPAGTAGADDVDPTPRRSAALDRDRPAHRSANAPGVRFFTFRARGRSRLPQHAWALGFAIPFVPVTIYLLGLLPWASDRVISASGTGEAAGPAFALLGLTVAAAVMSWLIGWSTAVFSSLTSWLYALVGWLSISLFAHELADMHLLDPLSNSFNGLTALVTSGTAASLVIVVAGVAVGTSIARRAGRADERAEATTGHARARRGDHVLATAPALALGAAGAWIVALAAPGEPAAAGWLSWSMLAGAAMLALCAMTAGISSIGAQVAGGLIAVVAFLQTTLLGTGMDVIVLRPDQSSTSLSDGSLLVLGIALAMGASGAHWARRSGQRWQRVEMAIAQVTRSAGSPARRGRRRGR